ncbi:MAG TPA: hypothetical protein VME69_12300 [Methylocella sp.]|nr:hypothetical protein [Methylocella sp.]
MSVGRGGTADPAGMLLTAGIDIPRAAVLARADERQCEAEIPGFSPTRLSLGEARDR